jgi:hypothetical protein
MTWRDKLELGLKEDAAYPAEPSARPGTPQPSQDRSSPARSSKAQGVVKNRET